MKGQEITEILFMLFGSGAIFSGLMVITSKNPMHSVFYLVLAFANVSMLLILLGVEFLALLFLIVYVGAIAILFLFVVMMLNIKLVELLDNSTRYIPIGFIIGAVFLTEISKVLIDIAAPNSNNPLFGNSIEDTVSVFNYNNISSLGYILYTEY
jgi:NADH-quinone oxidoreductase subunit J